MQNCLFTFLLIKANKIPFFDFKIQEFFYMASADPSQGCLSGKRATRAIGSAPCFKRLLTMFR
jgi:hypothetical protein